MKSLLGNNVEIGTGCVLKNCAIGDGSIISPYTVIEDANLAQECTVGPFARSPRRTAGRQSTCW